MGARLFSKTGRSALRKDAEPLQPSELIQLRKLLRNADVTGRLKGELEDYEDAHKVAKKLGLGRRTVLDLANARAFDVNDKCKAWKPAHNRLRIPVRGVQAYIERRAIFSEAGASVGTGEEEA